MDRSEAGRYLKGILCVCVIVVCGVCVCVCCVCVVCVCGMCVCMCVCGAYMGDTHRSCK